MYLIESCLSTSCSIGTFC